MFISRTYFWISPGCKYKFQTFCSRHRVRRERWRQHLARHHSTTTTTTTAKNTAASTKTTLLSAATTTTTAPATVKAQQRKKSTTKTLTDRTVYQHQHPQ